ncbi:MAG: histidinol-phosphate transaminase [Anaerolineae bacterium]|jgi:histidinol-phosphate aminotransferase
MSTPQPSHPYLNRLEPYEPPDLEQAAVQAGVQSEALIRLVANENLFGLSPCAAEALASFGQYHFHPEYAPLKEAVAGYAGVAPDRLVLSNGADEMIDLLIRLFVEPGEAIITCPPTFSMYRFSAHVNRCDVLTATRREDLSVDPAAVERVAHDSHGAARLLFIVSPGNPSAQAIPLPIIERLLALPLLVAVDEAYIEFGGESAVGLLRNHGNLVVIRTFSKWAGMAGLRLGYALLAPELARALERIRPPYNVNAAAMVAALATLDNLDTVQANVARLIAERERLRKALAAVPWLEPLPSQANFILCRVKGRDERAVAEGLLQRGILIRHFSGSGTGNRALAGHIRVTVGRPQDNEALVTALRSL